MYYTKHFHDLWRDNGDGTVSSYHVDGTWHPVPTPKSSGLKGTDPDGIPRFTPVDESEIEEWMERIRTQGRPT